MLTRPNDMTSHVKATSGRRIELPSPEEKAQIQAGIAAAPDTWGLTEAPLMADHPFRPCWKETNIDLEAPADLPAEPAPDFGDAIPAGKR